TPPRTPAEETVAAIWRDLLGHEAIGVDESFFALGGHSLLATQAPATVRPTFGVEISLREPFQSPTLATLPVHIDARKATACGSANEEALTALLSGLGQLSDDELRARFAGAAVPT